VKHLPPESDRRLTLKQVFTFAQLNNWYHMTDEDREKEIIEKRVEESKEKPLTREDLIKRFGALSS
jgi:hypothetical protein